MNRISLANHNFTKQKSEFSLHFADLLINEALLSEGLTMLEDVMVWRVGNTITVYNRICDHSGGRLITTQGKTLCPLHGWEFDPSRGIYLNVEFVKAPLFQGNISKNETITVQVPSARRATEKFTANYNFSIRFLNHACMVVDLGFIKFATDPWISGSAFCNGWWLKSPSPVDSYTELNSCDFLYISHNHPDHLHPETLSKVRRDIPIITGNFRSRSSQVMLEDMRFIHVHALNFDEKWLLEDREFAISILKSGDFRDDSALFVEIGSQTVLFNVDSNFTDFWRFPDKIDIFASSFAGGASGFPLCFDNYEYKEKSRILKRNINAIRSINKKILQKVRPRAFVPYAGFFDERAERDSDIRHENIKNNVNDYSEMTASLGVDLIDVTKTPLILVNNSHITCEEMDVAYFELENPERLIAEEPGETQITSLEIEDYFLGSEFFQNLDLHIQITDDEFLDVFLSCFVQFNADDRPLITFNTEISRRDDANLLVLRVREGEFRKVIRRGLPWEDLLIGFQCRVFREPNVYNVNFWNHFTNVYISDKLKRRSQDCFGCDLVLQQI